jgi:hypothetical protein
MAPLPSAAPARWLSATGWGQRYKSTRAVPTGLPARLRPRHPRAPARAPTPKRTVGVADKGGRRRSQGSPGTSRYPKYCRLSTGRVLYVTPQYPSLPQPAAVPQPATTQCSRCCDAHAIDLAAQHRTVARTSPWALPRALSSLVALRSGRPRLCTNAAHAPGLASARSATSSACTSTMAGRAEYSRVRLSPLTQTHTSTQTHTHMHARKHTRTRACIHRCVCVVVRACVSVRACLCAGVCVSVRVYAPRCLRTTAPRLRGSARARPRSG